MKGVEWLPFYLDDFWEDEDVVALSNEAVSLYLWLICRQWKHGSLPGEPDKIRPLCPRWDIGWEEIWGEVERLFPASEDGRRRNQRCASEADRRKDRYRQAAESGRKGGLARVASMVAQATLERASSDPQAITEQNRTEHDRTKKRAAPPQPPTAAWSWKDELRNHIALDCPEVETALDSWVAYRIEARLPAWKPSTWKKNLQAATEWGPSGLVESIGTSIRAPWRGLFPPRANGKSAPARRDPPSLPDSREYFDKLKPEWVKERERKAGQA